MSISMVAPAKKENMEARTLYAYAFSITNVSPSWRIMTKTGGSEGPRPPTGP